MIPFAILGLIVLVALTALQIALAAGAPLGEYAWGGRHEVLPRKLRIGSAVAIVLNAVFAAFLLSQADIVALIGDPVLTVGVWVIAAYAVLSAIPNAISRSKKERAAGTAASVLLAVSFLGVALSG